jgi:hypothetical protein
VIRQDAREPTQPKYVPNWLIVCRLLVIVAVVSDQLASNLDEASRLISDTLAAALAELETLEHRKSQLIALIDRTEAMKRALSTDQPAGRQMTLHEALAFLIKESGNRWMTVKELCEAVKNRHLYHKRDGSPVEINQIHARINNYEYLFEKKGPRVRLRQVP